MVRAYAHLAALRAGEACDGLGEDVCARAEGPERDVVTGEGVAVPGREGLGDEVALVRAGIGEREVEEAGPGDADVGEARIVPQPLAQEGGEGERAGASGPGRDERDIAGVVPVPPGPRHAHGDPREHIRGHGVHLPRRDGTPQRTEDGAGEFCGGHGSSVGEGGGVGANG